MNEKSEQERLFLLARDALQDTLRHQERRAALLWRLFLSDMKYYALFALILHPSPVIARFDRPGRAAHLLVCPAELIRPLYDLPAEILWHGRADQDMLDKQRTLLLIQGSGLRADAALLIRGPAHPGKRQWRSRISLAHHEYAAAGADGTAGRPASPIASSIMPCRSFPFTRSFMPASYFFYTASR
mgnify:CR=1 FL=1